MTEPAVTQTAREFYQTMPHCCGYPNCDGDLEGQGHDPGCPLYPDREELGLLEFAEAYARQQLAQANAENAELRRERDKFMASGLRLHNESAQHQEARLKEQRRAETAERSLKELREKMRWIPVADPPSSSEEVLTINNSTGIYILGNYLGAEGWCDEDGDPIHPTHYMFRPARTIQISREG